MINCEFGVFLDLGNCVGKIQCKGPKKRLNLFTAVNEAMRTALAADEKALVFGEDVAFGGVFRWYIMVQQTLASVNLFCARLAVDVLFLTKVLCVMLLCGTALWIYVNNLGLIACLTPRCVNKVLLVSQSDWLL